MTSGYRFLLFYLLVAGLDRGGYAVPLRCQMIQAGEIQTIVGDASREGMGGPQYCGLWSLTSTRRPFNAFGNSFAGLIPGDLRGKSPTLEVVDERTVALVRKADATYPVDARAVYQVKEPYYVDHTLTICDRTSLLNSRTNVREVSWCCYMNSPEDPSEVRGDLGGGRVSHRRHIIPPLGRTGQLFNGSWHKAEILGKVNSRTRRDTREMERINAH